MYPSCVDAIFENISCPKKKAYVLHSRYVLCSFLCHKIWQNKISQLESSIPDLSTIQ